MIKKIFLDIDDVLTQCVRDCMIHMGLPDYVRRDYPIDYRSITDAYKSLTGIRYSNTHFWRHFERQFWATLTPTDWCFDLIELCLRYVDKNNLFLLTSPTEYGDCLAGKHDWILRNMPDFLHDQYLIGPTKSACASEGVVLIDDSPHNTKAFTEAGGSGITFPQPWNYCRTNMGEELEYVGACLDYHSDWKLLNTQGNY